MVVELNQKILEANDLFLSMCSLRPQMSCFSPVKSYFHKVELWGFLHLELVSHRCCVYVLFGFFCC